MKKLLIFISLIFFSSNVYCQNLKDNAEELLKLRDDYYDYGENQNLKGNFKYGGEYQNGEPFKVTYRLARYCTVEGGSYICDGEEFKDYTVFFNFNNENKIKVVFPDGNHNIIYNVNNIEKTSYRQEAEGADQDGPPYNNMTVYLETDNKKFIIIQNKTKNVLQLILPK